MPKRKIREAKPFKPARFHAHIGRDRQGRLCYLGYRADGAIQAGTGLIEVAVVDIGRPFEIHVLDAPARSRVVLMIEGMTGPTAEPWTPSAVLAGAREGWFGFHLISTTTDKPKEASHAG